MLNNDIVSFEQLAPAHEVLGLNVPGSRPAKAIIQLMTVCCLIAQSLSLSTFRLSMTKIWLKEM